MINCSTNLIIFLFIISYAIQFISKKISFNSTTINLLLAELESEEGTKKKNFV